MAIHITNSHHFTINLDLNPQHLQKLIDDCQNGKCKIIKLSQTNESAGPDITTWTIIVQDMRSIIDG